MLTGRSGIHSVKHVDEKQTGGIAEGIDSRVRQSHVTFVKGMRGICAEKKAPDEARTFLRGW